MKTSRKAALTFIFITVLIDITGFSLIFPILPKLIAQLAHGDISTAASYGGWLASAYAIMQFFFAPILGNISDRYGRRPVLLCALLGFGIDYIFLAFAPSIEWLFVGRIIAGITGASQTVASAYVADISSPEERSRNFGVLNAAFGVGFIIGPVIGGLLGYYGTHVPFLVAAGLSLLNFLYGYFILPESLSPENRRRFEWKRANPLGAFQHLRKFPAVSGLIVAFTVFSIANHSMESVWSYYTIKKFDWDEKMIGYSLGCIGLLFALAQGTLPRLVLPKLGDKTTTHIGLLLAALGFLLFAFASKGWMMFVFLLPFITGGIAGATLQGIISNKFPDDEQGELQGSLSSLLSITTIIGPLMMTSLFAYFTGKHTPVYFPGAPFFFSALLTLGSVALTIRSLRNS
jgi:DHA1 family tetracycline resistance protein-like MFS transporter